MCVRTYPTPSPNFHIMSRWFHPHASTSTSTPNISQPPSRAPSPTRQTSRDSNGNTRPHISIPRNGEDEPLASYFTPRSLSSSGAATPASTVQTPYSGISGTHTPGEMWGSSGGDPVKIVLDNDHLVLRGYGSEMNPAYLTGRVDVNLTEATNVKEVTMALTCKAKVQFTEPGA